MSFDPNATVSLPGSVANAMMDAAAAADRKSAELATMTARATAAEKQLAASKAKADKATFTRDELDKLWDVAPEIAAKLDAQGAIVRMAREQLCQSGEANNPTRSGDPTLDSRATFAEAVAHPNGAVARMLKSTHTGRQALKAFKAATK